MNDSDLLFKINNLKLELVHVCRATDSKGTGCCIETRKELAELEKQYREKNNKININLTQDEVYKITLALASEVDRLEEKYGRYARKADNKSDKEIFNRWLDLYQKFSKF